MITGPLQTLFVPMLRGVLSTDIDDHGRIWQRLECGHSTRCNALLSDPGIGMILPKVRFCRPCSDAPASQGPT